MVQEPLHSTGWLHERSTMDVILIILTVVVGIMMIGSIVIIGVIEIQNPIADTSQSTAALDSHLGTIIGAVLGLMAGQMQGRREVERERLFR